MKTFKRILALVVVFCTVAAWMIPGVSAEETSKDLIVNFADAISAAGLVQDNYITGDNITTLAGQYETYNWKVYPTYSTYGVRVRGKELHLGLQQQYTANATAWDNYGYQPLVIKAPASGEYTLTLTAADASGGEQKATDVRAYIIDKPETDYTKAELNSAMASVITTTPLAQYNADESRSGVFGGKERITLEADKEYLLVLCLRRQEGGALDNKNRVNCYAQLQNFSLIHHEPIVHKTDSRTYNFKNDFTAAGISASTYTTAAAMSTLNTAYTSKTIHWTTYGSSAHVAINSYSGGGRLRWNGDKSRACIELDQKAAGDMYSAFKFRAPGTGNYAFSLEYNWLSAGDADATEAGAYILDLPLVDYTANNLPKENDESVLAKITFTPGTIGNYSSDKTVSLVTDQEYIIVFYAKGGAARAKTDFLSFTLTYQPPVVNTEYSVSYDANYDGADPIPADSLTSTAESAEFKAKVLERKGYTFEGWATTEDGAVEYPAGTPITVTSAKPSLNLYAVWSKVVIRTDDLVVDFYTEQVEKLGLIKDGTTNVATGGSFRSYYSNYRNAYIAGTINWQPYATNDTNRATLVALNTTFNGTESNGGLFSNAVSNTRLVLEMKAQTPGLIFTSMKFRSLGTGNYRLTVEHLKRASNLTVPTETGAYILAMPETAYTPDTLPRVDSDKVLTKVVLTDKAGVDGFYTSEGTVALEQGKEYIIVFYADHETAQSNIMFAGFSLNYQAPAASIGDVEYASVSAALQGAKEGDKIVLIADTVEGQLDLTDKGVTLDLNGFALNAVAVNGSVIDSTDGKGKIVSSASKIEPAENCIVLKDADGAYHIFQYTFNSLQNVSADKDEAVTGVNKTITFYDYEAAIVEAGGSKELKFRDVSADMAEKFTAGKLDWRVELGSQNYQFRSPGEANDKDGNPVMTAGSNGFSSGTQSIAYRSAGWFAIRIKSPGQGNMSVSLTTDDSNANTFDVYIVKASEIQEALGENYEAYAQAMANNLFNGGDNAIYTAYIAAVEAAFADEDVVISVNEAGVHKPFTGSYEFEADEEYVVICKVLSGTNMRLESLKFYRAERAERETQTFWSQLSFSNTDAYAVVAAGQSGLNIGFKAAWNGVESEMPMQYMANVIAEWAKAEMADANKDYGFYVRVSGFEALTETGTLSMTPYVESAYGGGHTATAVDYPVE